MNIPEREQKGKKNMKNAEIFPIGNNDNEKRRKPSVTDCFAAATIVAIGVTGLVMACMVSTSVFAALALSIEKKEGRNL